METVLIKFFRDASSYQSIDPACFDLQDFTEKWLKNNKKQFSLQSVVQSLCIEKPITFSKWLKVNGFKKVENNHYSKGDNYNSYSVDYLKIIYKCLD